MELIVSIADECTAEIDELIRCFACEDLVRCRDCVNYDTEFKSCPYCSAPDPDWYCPLGRKRNESNTDMETEQSFDIDW